MLRRQKTIELSVPFKIKGDNSRLRLPRESNTTWQVAISRE